MRWACLSFAAARASSCHAAISPLVMVDVAPMPNPGARNLFARKGGCARRETCLFLLVKRKSKKNWKGVR
jgi:hypothetical protein